MVTSRSREDGVPLSKSQAHRRIDGLRRQPEEIVKRDPEQEVRGMALPVVDAAFEAARVHLQSDDPLVRVATGPEAPAGP
ncbi:MAG TPA: hypothetical protein VNA57_11510 [Acidimicrobiales bacterium]|nr:hypothetical protein [Acidimicrobiales bacterium]